MDRPTTYPVRSGDFDLLRLPLLGPFLRWRHARTTLQLPLLALAALMVFDGFAGPQLAPKNLATVFTWVHYRGLVVLALLLAGNLFCMACPFMLVRNLARRLVRPARYWPRRLRHKWLSLALLAGLLFAYELLDLWAAPLWTACLILAYFLGALLVDSLFRGATFCKYVCPLGQFNFLCAMVSPLEVTTRDLHLCDECQTKDCIRGRLPARKPRLEGGSVRSGPRSSAGGAPAKASPAPARPGLSGCQLWLFQPRKLGNMDCTFCLDCVHACPHDNIGIASRLPASELWLDAQRSGVGRFSLRPDLGALAVVFAFGALLNAFAMVTPVYALEEWLAAVLGARSEAPVLLLIFLVGLILLPRWLVTTTGWLSRSGAAATALSLRQWVTRYSYALVPIGFGIWLAHYAFHFLTGFWTFVPLVQSFTADLVGLPVLGSPRWELGALLPGAWLYPFELGFLGLGWFGSLLVAYQLSAADEPRRAWRIFVPWAVLVTLLLVTAMWLMGQPMEMRGTILAG